MTTPNERYRAVQMAGQFLKELGSKSALSQDIRARANSIARNYPTNYDLRQMTLELPAFFSEEAED